MHRRSCEHMPLPVPLLRAVLLLLLMLLLLAPGRDTQMRSLTISGDYNFGLSL